jgi:tetratricopeptide (TPR) repeat protein
VWGGYLDDRRLIEPPLAYLQGPASPGTLARATPEPGRLRFKRFVDLRDVEAIRATGARYLVVHLRPVAEAAGKTESFGGTDYPETDPAFLARLAEALERQLGRSLYADEWIRVFDLRNLAEPLELPTDNATSLRNEAHRLADPPLKLAMLERAAALSPRDPRVRIDAAIVLLDRDDYGRALALFESALKLGAGEPADLLATAHDGCGLAHARLGRPAEAARHFAAALALRPDDPILVQRLETARREARDRADAEP